jgi:hypothetical protein
MPIPGVEIRMTKTLGIVKFVPTLGRTRGQGQGGFFVGMESFANPCFRSPVFFAPANVRADAFRNARAVPATLPPTLRVSYFIPPPNGLLQDTVSEEREGAKQ